MPPLLTSLHGYAALGGLLIVVLFSLRVLWDHPEAPAWLRWFQGKEPVYAASLLGCLLLFRWPAFFVPHTLNPDEAQFISGALTLWLDPVFWRSVDGQTAGPLIYYALMPLKLFGLLNYAGARLVGCLMVFGTLWFGYRSLRALAGEALARLCILPGLFFFSFTVHAEFVHYSSEHAPMLVLAVGLSGLFGALACADVQRFPTGHWLLAGAALGAVPFAKLQAVPPAAALLLTAAAWILTRSVLPWRRRWAELARLAAAVCLVPACFALMIALGGAGESFWNSYFVDNIAYLDHTLVIEQEPLVDFLLSSRAWTVTVASCLLLAALAVGKMDFRDPRMRWALLCAVGFLVASLPFTLITRRFAHYLLFLVMPSVLLAGVTMAGAWLALPTATGYRRLLAGLFAAALLAPLTLKLVRGDPFLAQLAGATSAPSEITRAILSETTPHDRMAVWGWRAELHAETGLPQGTSNSNAASQLTPSSIQHYFVQRYVAELKQTRPRIFVDAVGHAQRAVQFKDRALYAHEHTPALAQFIAEHYTYLTEIDHARIYRRKGP